MICYRSCNFCGGTSFRIFRRVDTPFPGRIYGDAALSCPDVGRRLKLQYLECARCGLVSINPLTRFADINRRSFDGERNIVAWASLDYAGYERDKRQAIAILEQKYQFEQFRRAGRVLDVSCGPGVSLQWLRDVKGWDVWGIDPDRHAARVARERYGLTVANGLIDDVRAPDEHFDLILMDNSLEHTFDPLGTLLACFRLLRKGGGLLIFVPNGDGLSTRFLNENVFWGHWFLYRPEALCEALWRIGFEVPRLVAIQNPVNPALAEHGCDIEPYREGLAVELAGAEEVKRRVAGRHFYADFFNLIAVKPRDAAVLSAAEEELRALALASLIERPAVSIAPGEAGTAGAGALEADVEVAPEKTRTAAGALSEGRRFGQTFRCTKDGLARIEILVATYAREIPRGTLELRLRAATGGAADLACLSIPANTVRDNQYVALEVGPLDDSAGSTYYLSLETRDIPAGYALTVWRSDGDVYRDGSFYVDDCPQPQAMCFRSYCR